MAVYCLRNSDGNVMSREGAGSSEVEARRLALTGQWTLSWPIQVWIGEIQGPPVFTLEAKPIIGKPEPVPAEPAPPPDSESPKASARRIVFHVQSAKDGGWDVRRSKEVIAHEDTKAAAIHLGSTLAREVHTAGGKSQLVIHNANGEIASERTYGDDPGRHPG